MPNTGQTEIVPTARLSRRAGLWLIAVMVAVIALGDIALVGKYNLGALYMIPFIVATQYIRRSFHLLLLSIVLIILNYLPLAWIYAPYFKPDEFLRLRLLNRSFVTVALMGSTFLAVFYLRARDYWLRRQAEMAPTDQEVALLVQVFQMFEDIIAVILAAILTAATYAIDYVTPRSMTLPILYLMPLAVVAITRSRIMLWITVLVLLVLAYIGFFAGPPDNYSPEILQRITISRVLSGGAIVVAATLFHLITAPKKHAGTATDARSSAD